MKNIRIAFEQGTCLTIPQVAQVGKGRKVGWKIAVSILVFFACVCNFPEFVRGLQGTQPITTGPWVVRLADQSDKSLARINVPSSLEDALQIEYDGTSIWQTSLPAIDVPPDKRLIVRFGAVATHAIVRLQNQVVGEHLGGWTPFECDLTAVARANSSTPEWSLAIEVDELVGHNTQGFLPMITQHFSGIWQPVQIRLVSRIRIVADQVLVRGDFADSTLRLRVPVTQSDPNSARLRCGVQIRQWQNNRENDLKGEADWHDLGTINLPSDDQKAIDSRNAVFSAEIPVPGLDAWTPKNPHLYDVKLTVSRESENGEWRPIDESVFRTGFSSYSSADNTLLANDEALVIRGVLNWGYAPPRVAPAIDEQWMRDEIQFAKERGFNLMKFCLWIPPRRYLELCDEMGIMVWIEYPTWHPRLDSQYRDDLVREYREFFQHDRNHPSVALRSLTCETGPGADLQVMQELYDLGKSMVPGCLIEDDSSWIEWNRIHDFYDDHPYGNNHTWVATLEKLKAWIRAHGPKPLVLGEALAADTWTSNDPWSSGIPWLQSAHSPWSVKSAAQWQKKMAEVAKPHDLILRTQDLVSDSLRYSMLMRKFQIETFRREVPEGGYVVSVIRDFPKAAMGLIDFSGKPKQPAEDWEFQGDSMLLLQTPEDCRSFEFASQSQFEFTIAGASRLQSSAKSLKWNLVDATDVVIESGETGIDQLSAANMSSDLKFPVPIRLPEKGERPTRLTLKVSAGPETGTVRNQWPLWMFPKADSDGLNVAVVRPNQFDSQSDWLQSLPTFNPDETAPGVLIVDRLNHRILDFLDQGGRVLMLPNGDAGSFELQPHWFLRGSAALFRDAGLNEDSKNGWEESLVDLQHFDLAGDVIPRVDTWMDWARPKLLLWDTHDLRECRTHGLVFTLPVGQKGLMTVSALKHVGKNNAAGRWFLRKLILDLEDSKRPGFPETVPGSQILQTLASNLERRQISLTENQWLFRPDEENLGHAEQWYVETGGNQQNSQWNPIKIGSHWESQGFEALDGWGWYKTTVQVPNDWPAGKCFLVFTGVDDYCDVFINGNLVGNCGDMDSQQTAFELTKAFNIGSAVEAGKPFNLTIAINDWNGAGGLFRPVFLETSDPAQTVQILNPLAEAARN